VTPKARIRWTVTIGLAALGVAVIAQALIVYRPKRMFDKETIARLNFVKWRAEREAAEE
jgi:hypothetical protein